MVSVTAVFDLGAGIVSNISKSILLTFNRDSYS